MRVKSPTGAHVTQLSALVDIVTPILTGTEEDATALRDLEAELAYRKALVLDKRVAACIRLFRWYALRFDQRQQGLERCLRGADEVVWSAWKRTFDAAGVTPLPPAPLSFVDSEPIPWASLHQTLPAEVRPPSADSFFTDRLKALPVPVIGLPPLAARRPWWLITALHECAHHVHQHLFKHDELKMALEASALTAKADPGEAASWAGWASECFADAFGVAFGGEPSVWAIEELERPVVDRLKGRGTYPSASVRIELGNALLAETLGDSTGAGTSGSAEPSQRVTAIAKTLLDLPLGNTTLRAVAGSGASLAKEQRSWGRELLSGTAQPEKTLEAAAHVVGAAVLAWREGVASPIALRDEVLRVLPDCRPDGTRAAAPRPDLTAASEDLLAALTSKEVDW